MPVAYDVLGGREKRRYRRPCQGFGLALMARLHYIAPVRRAVINHAPGAVFKACSRFVLEARPPDTDRAAGPGASAGPV